MRTKGTQIDVWVDGVMMSATLSAPVSDNATLGASIAGRKPGEGLFAGCIARVDMYPGALCDAIVTAIRGATPTSPNACA